MTFQAFHNNPIHMRNSAWHYYPKLMSTKFITVIMLVS